MALDEHIAVLARAPLLHLLDRDALRLLAFAAEGRSLKAGGILFRKGDRSDGGYVVTRGTIALVAQDEAPPVFLAEPGALIGRMTLFARMTRPATAVARTPASVLRISPTLIRRVLEEFPSAAQTLQAALNEDLTELMSSLDEVRERLDAVGQPAAPA